MQLQIIGTRVIKLTIAPTNQTNEEEREFKLNFEPVYDTDDDNVFYIVFELNIIQPIDFELDCTYSVAFKTSNSINDEFRESAFPNVNAPAIAFPFLRSLISTITLNSGFTPAILPSINFTEFKK